MEEWPSPLWGFLIPLSILLLFLLCSVGLKAWQLWVNHRNMMDSESWDEWDGYFRSMELRAFNKRKSENRTLTGGRRSTLPHSTSVIADQSPCPFGRGIRLSHSSSF